MRLFLKILIVYLIFALLTSIPVSHIWDDADDPDVDLYRNTAILLWPLFWIFTIGCVIAVAVNRIRLYFQNRK